jgi:hypothetical protein
MSWIQTHSGIKFDLLAPTPDMVDINDIAHALSNICRFNGHVREFYSVAQHSVHVSRLVHPAWALTGLLHDATEAYVGDMVRPLKALLPDYKYAEERIWYVIVRKFDLPSVIQPRSLKHADNVALMTERRDLMCTPPGEWGEGLEAVPCDDRTIHPMCPEEARQLFLDRFIGLTERAPA